MSTLVSILIPVYNAERWIEQTIESALSQTWPAKEVIVVDDGSTDRSLQIIKRFAGRVRWEAGPNRGSNAARNRLLALVAAVVGVLLIVVAIVYWAEPARSLPSFFPGHEHGSNHHHVKHGIAALVVGLACIAFAWFATGPGTTRRAPA